MKIAILNGNPEPAAFDDYLTQLTFILESNGHNVTQLDLCDLTFEKRFARPFYG
jgi:hypothetical protein